MSDPLNPTQYEVKFRQTPCVAVRKRNLSQSIEWLAVPGIVSRPTAPTGHRADGDGPMPAGILTMDASHDASLGTKSQVWAAYLEGRRHAASERLRS